MATFSYEILTRDGKKKKGTLDADSLEKARNAIKPEASTILSLKEASVLNKEITIGGKKKASVRDLSVFCRQFNSILKAGVSVVEALDMLSQQTTNKKMAQAISNARANVEKGDTLSVAMRREEGMFPDMLLNMIAAGEQSGSLETSLARMAVHFEKENKLKGLVKKAMMYPMVLLVVAVVVMIIMLTTVLPGFMETFDDMDIEMPAFTLAVMAVSDFLVSQWFLLAVILVSVIVGYKIFARSPGGSRVIGKLKLKLPVFGNLNTKTACSRFARTLSTLLAAGMSLVDALAITSKVIDNVVYEDALLDAQEKVKGGQPLSRPLKTSGIFPPMVVHMVGIGEETGNMEEMLDNVADYYDEEVTMATEQVTALLEPVIIIFLAVIVIGIIAAVYGPMMKLYDNI